MTNANCVVVHIDIDVDSHGNDNPQQKLDEGEQIRVVLCPLNTLRQTLDQFATDGYLIDAKLYTFSYALQYNKPSVIS